MKFLASFLLLSQVAYGCTTLIVGRNATADGSLIATHSNDGAGKSDPRLVFVPAADHAAGATRPIYYSPEDYPRYVGTERGIPAYYPLPSQTVSAPIGFIPQVAHTYQYFEETYAIINEHQVGIGESTCSCVNWVKLGGKSSVPCKSPGESNCSIMSIDTMSRIALERASTSRQAVQLMGELAEKYGFYGADSFEGSAESLMVIDTTEGWVFHVLPHPSGTSAVWAAARVPDDHVAVVANMFTISTVNLSDSQNFYGSDLAGLAAQYNIAQSCPSNEACDFTRTYSDGEYAHKYYSGRRMWGAYRLLTPDTNLPDTYNNLKDDAPYPFTIPVDPKGTGHRVDVTLAAKVHRDHYEGTKYDQTQGLAAGPFGTPTRYAAGAGEAQVKGNWERTISLYRTSDSYIVQARGWLPNEVGGAVWFGPSVASGTVYTPFPIGMTSIPEFFSEGCPNFLAKNTAYWAIRYVANLLETKYSFMYKDVQATQNQLETASLELQAKYDKLFADGQSTPADLTQAFTANAATFLSTYLELFDQLMFKYADGWVNVPNLGQSVGYPAWWLKAVGYQNGPPPPLTSTKILN